MRGFLVAAGGPVAHRTGMRLRVATCQFPISGDPRANLRHIRRQMKAAARKGAHVAHFAETALSGYAGVDLESLENYPWDALATAMKEVMALAKELKLAVVLGSTHWLDAKNKPHNSIYIIDERGRILDRYDKLFCTGNPEGTKADLKHYSPGDHFSVFNLHGVRCSALICHDFRYPELYRELRRRNVALVFHSFHNGHFSAEKARGKGRVFNVIVPATLQTYAAVNYQWVSATNTTRRHSAWGAFVVRPDGMISGQLPRERSGILYTEVDTAADYNDSSRSWRDRALRGVFHSGKQVRHPRSRARRRL